MKRVLQFTKLRFVGLVISILLIGAGIVGIFVRDGFNLGIDFQAGLNMRVQIAPAVFSVTSDGINPTELNVDQNELTITVNEEGERIDYSYPLGTYSTLGTLVQGINRIDGVSALIPEGTSPDIDSERILGLSHPADLGLEPVYINAGIYSNDDIYASIDEIRMALLSLEGVRIQSIGDDIHQEYSIRVEDPGTDKDFNEVMTAEVEGLLADHFGANQILVKQSDYVGPRFSQFLGGQAIYLTALALGLILVYIWIRFKLPYAVSAIVALTHDVLVMLGFIAIMQIEISTATIAAVLTIIGYSLNDTIVIFDRVRENSKLMQEADFRKIVNTSLSQSMSRTLITSLTTLLAVMAIAIFGNGAIQEFAYNLIVGIIVGTYSSIFVASPILMGWMNTRSKKKKSIEAQRFGNKTSDGPKAKKSEDKSGTDETGEEQKPAAPENAPVQPKQLERKERGKKRSKKKK